MKHSLDTIRKTLNDNVYRAMRRSLTIAGAYAEGSDLKDLRLTMLDGIEKKIQQLRKLVENDQL